MTLNEFWLVPVDEGYGVLRAPLSADYGVAVYPGRDEFNQSAGALTGKTAQVGGVWVGAGDADDFNVDAPTTGYPYRDVGHGVRADRHPEPEPHRDRGATAAS